MREHSQTMDSKDIITAQLVYGTVATLSTRIEWINEQVEYVLLLAISLLAVSQDFLDYKASFDSQGRNSKGICIV